MHLKFVTLFSLLITLSIVIETNSATGELRQNFKNNVDDDKNGTRSSGKPSKNTKKAKNRKGLEEMPQNEEPKQNIGELPGLDDLDSYDYNNYDEGER